MRTPSPAVDMRFTLTQCRAVHVHAPGPDYWRGFLEHDAVGRQRSPRFQFSSPWRTVYALNPMVAVVDGFRWALLGTPAPSSASVAASCAVAVVLLVSGSLFFRRTEQSFADIV